ncbi:3-methyl-2-oxobutanoate hydroxymethyltransferase [Actinobacteria bacterium YIM 96077]|uniref:3-methyl-2-oxobutanoate hydroxymethyltransferase n=1 Tax=Phytoactinopolyspora halophila TaxID=1981511 RepID=A0A329QAW4_9ACTN|nr:3-methyl-2-oxobutanoate hydroxymethyltransferase [Phytoactinopolyspora halophila]AYY13742.1 3-methyl-2-oxobutanoate hydroxymethyltransferase [Actinobacteria bacterium YIM 96077]RAW09473.1 3-methyl-2-oxobutanoate hydroxymethyltransferase [Phytoactinopolyspora halophila]
MADETTRLYGGDYGRRITIRDLHRAKERGERWPMLTSYEMYTAQIFDEAGIPVLLVGDSAANNVYAHPDTVPVTVDEMIPLARAVVRSTSRALVVCDLPFGSYQINPEQALATSIRIVKETGAQAVKLEGGQQAAESVRRIVDAGIAVMAHAGFTPQSVNALGGYRVQGRGEQAEDLIAAAEAFERAGAFALVLEMVTAEVAAEITKRLSIPVIGIGAGPYCDAQVLVWQDMAGMNAGDAARFVKAFGDLRAALTSATQDFADDVINGRFPTEEHAYH